MNLKIEDWRLEETVKLFLLTLKVPFISEKCIEKKS